MSRIVLLAVILDWLAVNLVQIMCHHGSPVDHSIFWIYQSLTSLQNWRVQRLQSCQHFQIFQAYHLCHRIKSFSTSRRRRRRPWGPRVYKPTRNNSNGPKSRLKSSGPSTTEVGRRNNFESHSNARRWWWRLRTGVTSYHGPVTHIWVCMRIKYAKIAQSNIHSKCSMIGWCVRLFNAFLQFILDKCMSRIKTNTTITAPRSNKKLNKWWKQKLCLSW